LRALGHILGRDRSESLAPVSISANRFASPPARFILLLLEGTVQTANANHSPKNDCQRASKPCDRRCTCRMDSSAVKPAVDPLTVLARLEAARKAAFEEQEAERWDGMA
jgi:hypothetical protein